MLVILIIGIVIIMFSALTGSGDEKTNGRRNG